MGETARILQFVPREDPQRLLRLQRASVWKKLDASKSELRKWAAKTQEQQTFLLIFDDPLDADGFGVADVEASVRAWVEDRRQGALIALVRYEPDSRAKTWSLRFAVK